MHFPLPLLLGLSCSMVEICAARPHTAKLSSKDFFEFLIQQYSNFHSAVADVLPTQMISPTITTSTPTTTVAETTTTPAASETTTPPTTTTTEEETTIASTTNAIEMNNATEPKPCQHAGFEGCCVKKGETDCFVESEHCFCDHRCYREGNCCMDIREVCPFHPTTCTDAGLSNGCCSWMTSVTCYVSKGQCYCDKYCARSDDCCSDVRNNTCEVEERLSEIKARLMRTSQLLLKEVIMAQEIDLSRRNQLP